MFGEWWPYEIHSCKRSFELFVFVYVCKFFFLWQDNPLPHPGLLQHITHASKHLSSDAGYQLMTPNNSSMFLLPRNCPFVILFGILSFSAPVSYTHLDVYKRQGYRWSDNKCWNERRTKSCVFFKETAGVQSKRHSYILKMSDDRIPTLLHNNNKPQGRSVAHPRKKQVCEFQSSWNRNRQNCLNQWRSEGDYLGVKPHPPEE